MTNCFGLAIFGILQQFRCNDLVTVIYSLQFIIMDTRLVGLFCVVSVVYLVNVVFASELNNDIVNLQHDTKVSLNFLVSVT